MASTFVLYIQPYFDHCNKFYRNIVTINTLPKGPLSRFIRKIKLMPLSEFKEPMSQKCVLGLSSFTNNYPLMDPDEIPILFNFLLENGYKIDTSITKMLNSNDIVFHTENANKTVCFVTYHG